MAFDPSSLQDIQGPDIGGSIARGFQLRDLANEDQLNQLKLQGARRDEQDDETLRSIIKGSDLSTDAGVASASSRLTQAGLPEQAMRLQTQAQQLKSGQLDAQLRQIQAHATASDYMYDALGSIINSVQPLADAKKPDGTALYTRPVIDAMTSAAVTRRVADIQNDTSLDPQTRKLLMGAVNNFVGGGGQASQPGQPPKPAAPITYDRIVAAYQQSKQGQAAMTAHLQQQNLTDQIHHRGVQEGQAATDQAERTRHDLVEERRGNAPSGFMWNPEHTALVAIPGGPKDPSATPGGGGRMGVYNQRIINAVGEATAAARSIGALGIDSQSRGVFGSVVQNITPLKVTGEMLNNVLSPQNVQLYNTRMAGLARQLGTLETSGLSAQGSLTRGLDESIRLQPGDTFETRLDKMAETRQIVDSNIDSTLTNPGLSADQKAYLTKMKSQIDAAIPITHADVDRLIANKGKKGYSLSDAMRSSSNTTSSGASVSNW